MIVVGALSGTSVDGIDVGVCEISHSVVDNDLEFKIKQLAYDTVEWKKEVRDLILNLCKRNSNLSVQDVSNANFTIGKCFADAIIQVLQKNHIPLSNVNVIGSHGQTIWHEVVEDGKQLKVISTLQIGEPSVIAQDTGVTTVADFRVRDVAAGGNGAPLVSAFDWYLLRPKTNGHWRAVQNIGGIGNVTFLPPIGVSETNSVAFDTGPGNVLMDWATAIYTNNKQLFDNDGKIASEGKINEKLVELMLSEGYFVQAPPKTTGRELFHATYATEWRDNSEKLTGIVMDDRDFIATLTELTAASIADSYKKFSPGRISEAVIGGGGSRNSYLLKRIEFQLEKRLGYHVDVFSHEKLGFDSDAKEALLFALLAYNTVHGIEGNLPSCTGAKEKVVLGKIVPGKNFKSIMFQ